MPDQPRKTVDAYINALDDDRRQTATALREAIVAAVPDATESIKWGQPVYDVNGPFAALKAFPRWVTLTFWRGAELADSRAMLQGDGDRMRHVRFSRAVDVDARAVQAVVRSAADLNRQLGDPTKRA
jgi:hypothetical protein